MGELQKLAAVISALATTAFGYGVDEILTNWRYTKGSMDVCASLQAEAAAAHEAVKARVRAL